MAWVLMSVLTGLLLALASPEARSRTVLDLDTRAQPVALQDWGDYWIDTSASLTPEQLVRNETIPWQATDHKLVYPVTSGQVVWIRLTVPPAPDAERWYLEVPYPALDRASLYTLDGAGQWNEQRAGDLIAVSQWPVPHRHPLLPIALSAEVPTKYLLRLENGHAFSAPLQFISEGRLSRSEQRVSLILGIFFGLTGLAAVISTLGALSLRDSAYGFYALCVTLMGLTQACITGIAGLHLWPDWPWWNDISSTVLPLLTVSATLLFISAAVALPERSRRLHRLMTGLAVVGVMAATALAWLPSSSRMDLVIPALGLLELGALFALVWAWRRGDRFAPWLLLSYLPLLIAASLTLAGSSGWLAVDFFTQYGMQIAVALNLPLVLVVLMLRSQHRRENIRRIQGLDRMDPSTGLINGHVFSARLLRMIARSDRLHHQSAVMLIDVINTEQMQRDFGRKAADELPLRVAERLLSTAREIDSAARLSERRFGMLVEGPFSAGEAASLGPRIVARCLMPYKDLPPDCVAQVHVVYALVPHRRVGAEDLLTQLEERLATIPARSRRKVFMLGEVLKPSFSRRASLAEAA
ncbi:MAG: 7TM diverse intracellular signaling domain-containing protein [Polaromonas sp.]